MTGPITPRWVNIGPQMGSPQRPVSAATQYAVFGIAHSNTEDDVYNENYIPKGTTILSNVWSGTPFMVQSVRLSDIHQGHAS